MQLFDPALSAQDLSRVREILTKIIAVYPKTFCADSVSGLLQELGTISPAEEAEWRGIVSDWEALDRWQLRDNCPPAGLPAGETHAFAVLGHELHEDGTIGPELEGRLEVALACAVAYPASRLILCGGPTWHGHPEVTEAALMKAWLAAHGVSASRLLTETTSTSTAGNAFFGVPLAAGAGIRSLSVVTSRYHVQRGSLLVAGCARMLARETGTEPIRLREGAIFYDVFRSEKASEAYDNRSKSLSRLYDLPYGG